MKTKRKINTGHLADLMRLCYCGDHFFPSRTNQRYCPKHQMWSGKKRAWLRDQLFRTEGRGK